MRINFFESGVGETNTHSCSEPTDYMTLVLSHFFVQIVACSMRGPGTDGLPAGANYELRTQTVSPKVQFGGKIGDERDDLQECSWCQYCFLNGPAGIQSRLLNTAHVHKLTITLPICAHAESNQPDTAAMPGETLTPDDAYSSFNPIRRLRSTEMRKRKLKEMRTFPRRATQTE